MKLSTRYIKKTQYLIMLLNCKIKCYNCDRTKYGNRTGAEQGVTLTEPQQATWQAWTSVPLLLHLQIIENT